MERKLRAVSIFSGAGGMDIGVLQAGFTVECCIDLDKNCCASLEENIRREGRKTRVLEADIRQVEPAALLKDIGYEPGEIDLLFGGPPCQAFSQIGKQQSLEDERGALLFQVIRFVEAIRPKALMMEQVKGLLTARDQDNRPGGVFKKFLEQLEQLGYTPKWKTLTAAQYGVPQLRQRVILVATTQPNNFEFPPPTHDVPEKCGGLFSLLPYTTVGEVIADLPSPASKEKGDPVPDNGHYDVTPRRDRERIHGVPEGRNLSSQTQLPEEQRRNLTKKDTTKFLRVDRGKPSNTLRGGEIFFHPVEDRYLTPREYMRIHGYPDRYVLRGPIRGRCGTVRDIDQHRQVGNSVPPPLARAVAKSIYEYLCQKYLNS